MFPTTAGDVQRCLGRRYQRQGLGRRTLDVGWDHVVGLRQFRRLLLSYVPELDGPKGFYLSYGFIKAGRLWDNGTEIVRLLGPFRARNIGVLSAPIARAGQFIRAK